MNDNNPDRSLFNIGDEVRIIGLNFTGYKATIVTKGRPKLVEGFDYISNPPSQNYALSIYYDGEQIVYPAENLELLTKVNEGE